MGFLYHSKSIGVLISNCDYLDHFLRSYGGLKIANLVDLGQLSSDIFQFKFWFFARFNQLFV